MKSKKKYTENHHFTVVIPTRERYDTLEHALHTCAMQDYDNLEIIVSDNYSQDNTREVVESYKDSRIRYINTGKRVSMSNNYEFALSNVRPEGYVIYIGDDDGLLPNAIHDINATINQTGAQVLRWDVASYFWPNIESKQANQLYIPSITANISSRDSANAIREVLSFKALYASLPVMYMYSVVKYDVIKRIKDSSERFYHSLNPDVYSGFAIAGAVKNYVNTKRPYVIAGASHHSIGASAVGGFSSGAKLKFFSEDNLPFHQSLVHCVSIEQYVIECFLQARDHLPFFEGFSFDMKKLVFHMIKTAATKPEAIYNEIKDAVLQLGDIHNISNVAQKAIDDNPNNELGKAKKSIINRLGKLSTQKIYSYITREYDSSISIDCSAFNVKNIYDASILCGNILSLEDRKMLRNPAYVKLLNKISRSRKK